MISIFIDESGSFVPADFFGAWNITAAAVIPNSDLVKDLVELDGVYIKKINEIYIIFSLISKEKMRTK